MRFSEVYKYRIVFQTWNAKSNRAKIMNIRKKEKNTDIKKAF